MNNTAPALNEGIYVGDPYTPSEHQNDRIQIDFNGALFEVNRSENRTVLDILLNEGKDHPYSCKEGICMSCMVVIDEGTVWQPQMGVLHPDDLEKRRLLACQAVPVSNRVKIRTE